MPVKVVESSLGGLVLPSFIKFQGPHRIRMEKYLTLKLVPRRHVLAKVCLRQVRRRFSLPGTDGLNSKFYLIPDTVELPDQTENAAVEGVTHVEAPHAEDSTDVRVLRLGQDDPEPVYATLNVEFVHFQPRFQPEAEAPTQEELSGIWDAETERSASRDPRKDGEAGQPSAHYAHSIVLLSNVQHA